MIPTYGHLALFLWQRPTIGVQSRERVRKAQHRRRRMLLTLLAIVGFLVSFCFPLRLSSLPPPGFCCQLNKHTSMYVCKQANNIIFCCLI